MVANHQTAPPKSVRPFFRILAGLLCLIFLLVFILVMYELVVEGTSNEGIIVLFLSLVGFYVLSWITVTGHPPGTKVGNKLRHRLNLMLIDGLFFLSKKCKKKNED